MLDAAGYPRGSDGTRVDKQGKPINLRLYVPNTDPDYAKDAQFIQGWFGQVGIKVTTQVLDEGTLVDDEALDTTKPVKGQLDYDMVIWGWVGDPDPNALLQILLTSSIGSTSDSQWSNAAVRRALRPAERGGHGRRAQDVHGPDAADLLRPGAVRHPVLRQQPATPTTPTSSRAGRTSRSTAGRRSSRTARSTTPC